MRIIRKPQIERDQKRIRSGYAAGYKKGMEEAAALLDNVRITYGKEITTLQRTIESLRRELDIANANAAAAVAKPNIYVDTNSGGSLYYVKNTAGSEGSTYYTIYTTV